MQALTPLREAVIILAIVYSSLTTLRQVDLKKIIAADLFVGYTTHLFKGNGPSKSSLDPGSHLDHLRFNTLSFQALLSLPVHLGVGPCCTPSSEFDSKSTTPQPVNLL